MSNQISIEVPSDFNFQECLWFLDRNYDDCMHKVDQDQVIKVIEIYGKKVLVSISFYNDRLQVEVLNGDLDQNSLNKLKAFIANWFDIEKSLQPFYSLLKNHKELAYMADDYKGLRLIGIPNLFEAICWAIIGQQINLNFAYRLKRRLVEKYGSCLRYNGDEYHVFPTYEALANALPDDLREMQFSKSKAEYLITIARAFARGEISKEYLIALPDLESRQKKLLSIRGIGTWTANYALMKSLKEHSCIPYGDAGLLNSLLRHNIIADKKQHREIEMFFNNYKGWESYLVFYLWRSLAKK